MSVVVLRAFFCSLNRNVKTLHFSSSVNCFVVRMPCSSNSSLYCSNLSSLLSTLFSSDTKTGSILRASLMWLSLLGTASLLELNRQNTFDFLREKNQLTNAEAFFMLFGQQLCAAAAFTALEVREDRVLSPRENACRGEGTEWPRSRVFKTIYQDFPIHWSVCFAVFMALSGPMRIFSSYTHESWSVWGVKMALWFAVWELQMYIFHRLAHSYPWLYRIAHKGHHAVMDFPLGPHAPALEKLAHYASSIVASRIVGISAGSWTLALNILMTQCVLEHAYSSLHIAVWHDLCAFNTADLHQAHHVRNDANFGYAFNFYDGIFGTLLPPDAFKEAPPTVTGPATPARDRTHRRGKFQRAIAEAVAFEKRDSL